MGKGNYLFRGYYNEPINTYYIEVEEEYEEHFLEDFKENLKEIINKLKLPNIEQKSVQSSWNCWESIYIETGTYQLRVADNEWSVAIACVPKIMEISGDRNPMFGKSANKIMKEIHKIYGLKARASAWTSTCVLEKEKTDFY